MAGTTPRGITKKQIETMYNPGSQNGVKTATKILDGSTLVEIIKFGDVVAKLTVQSTDSLVCDVTVSINGTDFITALTGVDNSALQSYELHNVTTIKVTRTAGTGRLHISGTL